MTDFPCLICMCELNIEKNEHYIKFYCNQCKISKKYYDSLENEAYKKFVKYCETRREEIESDFSKNKEKKKRDEDYENVFRLFNPYRVDDDFIPPVKNSTKQITPEILDDLGIKKIIPSQTYEDIRKIIGDIEIDTFLENILFSGDAFVCSVDSFNPENAEFDSSLDVLGKLPSNLKLILKEHGINDLYRYQKQTFKTILEQKDVFITAPTSSGKTESFLIPILQKIINDGTKNQVEAIIVYPTKALADDQLKRLKKYCDSCGIKVENIHGDVSSAERKKIYSNPPQILLTNFDMIHYHLWNNDDFAKLISTAKILAIDEVHKYGGIFGSNVHNIIKRLKRICGILQIIAASATLENPENFCEKLFGNKFQIIQGSGNRGKIIFCMLYPLKKSQNEMMISLISELANQDHKILSFSNSRMGAEEISIGCKKNGISIEVHRAGILKEDRKENEENFLKGNLKALSATPTLELGINIGDIDAIVSELVPFNNFKQRMGRAGRSNQKISYAFMILNDKDPISQYYQKHPQDYKTDNLEILLDPENPYVKKIHLLFMACDKALSSKEMNFVDNDLISSGVLNYTGEGFSPNPSLKKYFDNYSIRDIGQQVEIETNHKKIGEWDKPMAYQKLFPGSVYLHNGNVFRSVFFNDDFKPKVIVKDITKEYPYIRTQPRIEKFPIVEKNLKTEKLFDFSISLCYIYINYVIREFKEWNTVTNETKIKHLVTDFKFSLNTMGIEIDLNPLSKKILDSPTISQNKSSAFHTLEHVLIHSSNMIAGGVAGDIDGISIPSENKICIFDRSTNGGNGACKALFLILEKAINRSLDILNSCLCGRSDGCPRCTYLYGCDKFNSDLNKDGAKILLRIMLNSQNSLN